MQPFPDPPRTFRDVVEADLRRAARLIVRFQAELDPQIRVGTRDGDWAIAMTLPDTAGGRHDALRAVSTFMTWKQARCFTFAAQLVEPDAVWCCGVALGDEQHACLARIKRSRGPIDMTSFGEVEWLDAAATIDPLIVDLMPTVPRAMTSAEVSEMAGWFGRKGRFPAVNLATGEVGA